MVYYGEKFDKQIKNGFVSVAYDFFSNIRGALIKTVFIQEVMDGTETIWLPIQGRTNTVGAFKAQESI